MSPANPVNAASNTLVVWVDFIYRLAADFLWCLLWVSLTVAVITVTGWLLRKTALAQWIAAMWRRILISRPESIKTAPDAQEASTTS